MTDQDFDEQTHPEQDDLVEDDLLEDQEHKGYGEDEGERGESFPGDDDSS